MDSVKSRTCPRALIAVMAVGATVSVAAEALPAAVQKELDGIKELCVDIGGRPQAGAKLHQAVELRPGAPKDHVINTGEAVCQGAPDPYGGSGGATVIVYASRDDGTAFQAFAQGADGVRIEQQKGSTLSQVSLRVGGALCGQRKNARTVRAEGMDCWRPIRWSPTKNEFEFAPLSEIQTIK